MSAPTNKSPMTPVLVQGAGCIGHVIARGKQGFEAYDVNDKALGMFTEERSAIAVLINAKRG